MIHVVLDTCVLVAAARSRTGASHALLSLLPHPGFQLVLSVSLFAEYHDALLRPDTLGVRPAAQAEGFLDYLVSISHLQEVYFHWRPALPDPGDDMVLELASAAGCRYIVTHNLRDFAGVERWGCQAVTPGRFLRILEKSI